MLAEGIRLAASLASAAESVVMEPVRTATGLSILDDFDIRQVGRGFSLLFDPGGCGLLDFLGDDREERVETASGLLRGCSDAELNELLTVFQLACMRVQNDKDASSGCRSHSSRRRRRAR
jgi:hypothetical protein